MKLALAPNATRVHVEAWWNDSTRLRPVTVEGAGGPEQNRVVLIRGGSFLILQDLPPDLGEGVVVSCPSAPDRILARPIAKTPVGASGSGLFPRCLAPKPGASSDRDYEVESVIETLNEGGLEEALAFAGYLCLAEASSTLEKLVPAIAAYARAHALHRCDALATFAAALSGLRRPT
jgi:hypothetical protein